MINSDNLQRFLFEDIAVRGELVHLEKSYQEIIQQHNYPPIIRRLLGEALVLVSLLTATIKFKGRVTMQFQSKGKLKLLLAQCNHELQIRGLVQCASDLQPADLLNDFKQGQLVIIMDPDAAAGKRYQGIVAWRGHSLTESIEGYFRDSEQLPTRIWVAVNETQAAGLFLQVIPREGDKRHIPKIMAPDQDWEHVIHLTNTITSGELLQLENEVLLRRLYVEESVRVFHPELVTFRCTCSVARSENAILLLGRKEAEEELAGKKEIVVTCEFCNKAFIFDRVDIEKIFRKGGTPPSSTQIH